MILLLLWVAAAEHIDLPVRGFFTQSQDAIFDIPIQDFNAKICVNKDSQKCSIASENKKKKKCPNQMSWALPHLCSLCCLS